MDILETLRVAMTVMKAGSFSAAARQLGQRPAWVSQQMATLEERLGLRLFERSTRALAPTAEGRELLDRVKPALQDIDDALAVDTGAEPRGLIRVSIPAAFASMALLPVLPDFFARFPSIDVELQLENRFIDLVAEKIDCTFGVCAPADSSRVARPLIEIPRVMCASPAYVHRHGMPQSVADLAHHACIGVRSVRDGKLQDWSLGGVGDTWVAMAPRGPAFVNDPAMAAEAAEAGCGIALVGEHHVAIALHAGQLVRVLPEARTQPFELSLYYARRKLLPSRVKVFVDHVLATVPGRLQGVLRGDGHRPTPQHLA